MQELMAVGAALLILALAGTDISREPEPCTTRADIALKAECHVAG